MPDLQASAASFQTAGAAAMSLAKSFRTANFPTPELDARLLVLHVCGLSHEAYILRPDHPLSRAEIATVAAFRERRLAYEPVSRIIGFREFWGRNFKITPAVLDPRPDTETLIEAALALLREENRLAEPLRILDLGTGSGCILLTLAAELTQSWGVGSDLDAGALAVARGNSERLNLGGRCSFVRSDWCKTFRGQFDVIVCNPPYIKSDCIDGLSEDVRRYDPSVALDGGADGLEAYRQLVPDVFTAAAGGGWILLEVGCGQAVSIFRILQAVKCAGQPDSWRVFRDLSGTERVVAVKRQKRFDKPSIKKTVGNSLRSG